MRKKIWMRLTALFLMLVMVITGIHLPEGAMKVNAASTQNSIIVHYKGTDSVPNIYYWNTNGTSDNPVSWPGKAMASEGNNWYGYTFKDVTSINLIFNSNGKQTKDLSRTSGEWWYKDSEWYSYNPEGVTDTDTEIGTGTEEGNTGEKITVHFKSSWGGAKIYYWAMQPAGISVNWPGASMVSEGNDWYSYTLENTSSANIIFNYNGNQTKDLSRTSGEWWYKDSQWYSSNPEGTQEEVKEDSITVHFKSTWGGAKIYYWGMNPAGSVPSWPGKDMVSEGNNWYTYTLKNTSSTNLIFNYNGNQTADLSRSTGEWWYKDSAWHSSNPETGTGGETGGGETGGGETGGGETGGGETGGGETGGEINDGDRVDFRDETIYFVMVTRFYDGDTSNNVHCWDEIASMKSSNDPAWRGDFKGLIEKLDYIKALGFSAIWITPVVKNISGYDYHGYHASNHAEVDSRYESSDVTYQDLIDAAHDKGMKVIQDIVLNHTGNFGEENLYPLMTKDETVPDTVDALVRIDSGKLPANYDSLTPDAQYQARIAAMKEDVFDTERIYHHEKSLSWEGYTVQTGQIAGDCVDLNTENPKVSDYLIDSYSKYINMGVDAFRIDTVKHISRLTFNKEFVPAFKKAGGDDFYMFGEVATRYRQVWNNNIPAVSTPFYTWAETKNYAWTDTLTREASAYQHWKDNQNPDTQPSSNNHLLNGNTYHKPDTSKASGLNVIDFPMHWNFNNARDAFNVGVGGDSTYNDATWNVTYVDSHDYAPDCAPENQRFAGSQDTWAENLNLMYTFRGIPCIYYGSEIEFKKGAVIDVGPKEPLSETGRAYFGDYIEGSVNVTDFAQYSNATGAMKETLSHPLSLHIQRLNQIRRSIPALRKGQYSLEGVSGEMAFKRRFTDAESGVDSFVLVSITGGASFSGIPNGTYKDAITGDVKVVSNGTLSIASTQKGNMRIYVLDLPGNPAPGKIGTNGTYLK